MRQLRTRKHANFLKGTMQTHSNLAKPKQHVNICMDLQINSKKIVHDIWFVFLSSRRNFVIKAKRWKRQKDKKIWRVALRGREVTSKVVVVDASSFPHHLCQLALAEVFIQGVRSHRQMIIIMAITITITIWGRVAENGSFIVFNCKCGN